MDVKSMKFTTEGFCLAKNIHKFEKALDTSMAHPFIMSNFRKASGVRPGDP